MRTRDHWGRDLWLPDFHVTTVTTIGAEWPDYIVEKWETNEIGEKRYVATRYYSAPIEQTDA